METETLSSYEQPQDKHILDGGMNVNIPNHDEDSNSNEINEVDSDISTEPVSSSSKKDTEENCDETVSSTENKVDDSTDNLEEGNAEEDDNDTLNRSINSPNVSSTNHEEDEENCLSDQESSTVNDESKHEEEEKKQLSDQESSTTNDERKLDSSNKEQIENEQDIPSSPKKDSQENEDSVNTTNDEKINEEASDPLELNEEGNNDGKTEVDSVSVSEKIKDDGKVAKENDTDEPQESPTESKESESEKNKDVEEVAKEKKNETEKSNDTDETLEKSTHAEGKESAKTVAGNDYPLLKETLTKTKDGTEDKEADGENGNEEMEMDDDFDPSLLCPDIAMEVDEAPVITTTDSVPADGSKSPLLYDPVYSTYVDEMTGAEVTFNLTPEEHQMRQDMYGDKNPIQFTRIHCTACNVHLGSALDGQGNRFVHPLLKVLICKDCYHFYTSGEFEKDEDGSELYCRWCGQGGQVMCCSACEMVFCKKCIRINFGRKKLTEIRDSDDWYCFRCNPLQLTELRVHCAEFMEYVRREISRAATLENATSFTTTDYTQCCISQKKKIAEPSSSEPKKKRKKWVDPDYEPELDIIDPSKPAEVKFNPLPKVVPILPKPPDTNVNIVTQAGLPNGVFKVGNTTFKPRVSTFSQIRPTMQVQQPGTSTGIRPQSSGPGYIKIMPSGIRATTSVQRQPAQTFVSSSVRQQGFQQRQIRAPANTNNAAMKHEWFEKTVRAAARVNSNLSYTLTQLNRAQSTATSVEALAVVHNKLQEILSTSINSLIQIRKNLRTEFIAGIKNIRFPPKPPQARPLPSTSAQDDDVIFVSPTTSPVPPPLVVATSTSNLTPSVTLINSPSTPKKASVPIIPTTSLQPIPSTSTITSNGERPKVFLRVKSLSALQNVPSECITIPDDPLPPPQPPALTPIKPSSGVVTLVDDSPEKEKEKAVSKEIVEDVAMNETEKEKMESEVNSDGKCDKNLKEIEDVYMEKKSSNMNEDESNFKALPLPPEVKLLNIKVCLRRSDEIDALVRNKFELMNGDSSE